MRCFVVLLSKNAQCRGIRSSAGVAPTLGVFYGRFYPWRKSKITTHNHDISDNGAAAGHLLANRAAQTFRQAPPPHPPTALTLRMAMLARRPLSGPPTPPTGPTRPQTMMEEMGEFSPILPLLVNSMITTSANRLHSARIRQFATVVAATTTMGS